MGFDVAATYTLDKPILQGLKVKSSTAQHDLGFAVSSTDGREYTYALHSTNTTAASAVTYPAFLIQGGTYDGWSVTTTHDADLGRNFAGVLCSSDTVGGNYLWVQTKGYVPSCLLSTSVSAEDSLTCAEAGMLTQFLSTAVSTSVAGVTFDLTNAADVGVALEADSSGLGDAILK